MTIDETEATGDLPDLGKPGSSKTAPADPSRPGFDPRLAWNVKADLSDLTPRQVSSPRAFMIAADSRQRVMLKHPHLSIFHSYAEFLHAALLEGDATVVSYCPQPFRLRIGSKRYIPDCFIAAIEGPPRVIELRPQGQMDAALQNPLTAYFGLRGWRFEVIGNESIYERQIEAENWVEIVEILYLARDRTTDYEERGLWERFCKDGSCALGDLIDPSHREQTYNDEIALFRMLHRGQLRATLTERPLDFDTEFSLCT